MSPEEGNLPPGKYVNEPVASSERAKVLTIEHVAEWIESAIGMVRGDSSAPATPANGGWLSVLREVGQEVSRAAVERERARECSWADDGSSTECGGQYSFDGETASTSDMAFCPYCGGRLVIGENK